MYKNREPIRNSSFDNFVYRFISWLYRNNMSLIPTSSRWGLSGLFATISFSFVAISIALWSVYLTKDWEWCLVFAAIVAGLGIILGVTMLIVGIYMARNQYIPASDLLLKGFLEGSLGDDIPDKEIDRAIVVLGEKIGVKTKNWVDKPETTLGNDINQSINTLKTMSEERTLINNGIKKMLEILNNENE